MSDFDFDTPVATKPERKGARLPKTPQEYVMTEPDEPIVEAEKVTEEDSTSEYDPVELAKIFDEIIFAGEYTEEVLIKGKLRVGFRTRTTEEVEEISRLIDATSANLVATLAEKRMILHLQYALVFYQGRDLRGLKTEERSKLIRRLPAPIIGVLVDELQKFDQKVFKACKDGEENF